VAQRNPSYVILKDGALGVAVMAGGSILRALRMESGRVLSAAKEDSSNASNRRPPNDARPMLRYP